MRTWERGSHGGRRRETRRRLDVQFVMATRSVSIVVSSCVCEWAVVRACVTVATVAIVVFWGDSGFDDGTRSETDVRVGELERERRFVRMSKKQVVRRSALKSLVGFEAVVGGWRHVGEDERLKRSVRTWKDRQDEVSEVEVMRLRGERGEVKEGG